MQFLLRGVALVAALAVFAAVGAAVPTLAAIPTPPNLPSPPHRPADPIPPFLSVRGATTPVESAASSPEIPALDPRLEGYPELHILRTDEAIVVPATVAAGRTLVIEENDGTTDGNVFLLRVPDDIAGDAIDAALASPETPEWFSRSGFAGNPDRAAPGEPGKVGLIDLIPGRYLVIDPVHPKAPGRFDAVPAPAATPAVLARADPVGDVVVEMVEMAFTMPAAVPAGQTLWQVTNSGAAPHEIAIAPVPDGATEADVLAAMTAVFAGQPVPADLGSAWAERRAALVNGVGVTSPGGTVWAQFDLTPGTYAAVCFFPDENGPHLMSGMIQIFAVS